MFLRAGLIAAALLLAAPAWAEVPVPPVARVTDQTGTLSRAQQQALSDRLAAFEQAKGSQIAVLVLPTTEPETIEQYAIGLLLRAAERAGLIGHAGDRRHRHLRARRRSDQQCRSDQPCTQEHALSRRSPPPAVSRSPARPRP